MNADERVARLLAPAAGDAEPALSPEEEAASLAAVTAALQQRRPAARWQRPLLAVAALAAFLVLGTLLRGRADDEELPVLVAGAGTRADGAASTALSAGERLREGMVLRAAPGGTVSARFPEGTTLALSRGGELALLRLDRERRLGLRAGALEAQVMKLGAGERFLVETQRAVLEVRGTRFAVDVTPPSEACRDGAISVRVDEGQVSVDVGSHEPLRSLRAGDALTLPCAAKPAVDEAPPAPPSAPPPSRASPPPESSLTRMNAMYERALRLKRDGQLDDAARELAALRRAFPLGPLDEAAAVEELRLLERLDPARAQRAARQYLDDYPSGYARDVAQRLIAP
jgi:hypothetical protein